VVGNIGKYVSSLSWHAGIITKLYNKGYRPFLFKVQISFDVWGRVDINCLNNAS
jgi:hypothetical protein